MNNAAAKIQQLEQALREERNRNRELSRDSAFGMLTRPAAFLRYKELRQGGLKGYYVVLCDLDKIHNLNKTIGEIEVDRRIRRAFRVRKTDVVFIARYRSGDEIIIAMKGDPKLLITRLQKNLEESGLSGTFSYCEAGQYLRATAEKLSAKINEQKAKDGRGTASRL